MQRSLHLPASGLFASVLVLFCALISLPARSDVSQVRVNEFQTACVGGAPTVQFVELTALVNQDMTSSLSIRILDHTGANIVVASSLFGSLANGTVWPSGKTWLLASSSFSAYTGLTADKVLTGPSSILDPAGGTIILRLPAAGGTFTIIQQFTYGSVGGPAAPASGHSVHLQDDMTYADSSPPDPTTFAGARPSNLSCFYAPPSPVCPKNTLNGVLYSAHSKSGPGNNATAGYDVPSGRCNTNGSAGDMGFHASVSALDSFTVTGLTAGTPVDIVARLHSILSASAWAASLYNPGGDGYADVSIQSGGNSMGIAIEPRDGASARVDSTLSLPLHVNAGQPFALSFGSTIGGGFANATTDAQLSFSGLAPGVQVTSCQGFTTDVPTAVAASLSSLDATPDRVRIAWMLADARASNTTLERSGLNQAWSTLATLVPDGRGEVSYEDVAVRAGARYGYRLRILTPQGTELAGETWVDIPSEARLSLGGAVPNPATDRLVISFALAGAERATLDLLDIAGRRVIHRDVSAFGAGLHRVDLGATHGLEPGIYLLRLSQGSSTQVKRISLLH